MCTQAEKEYSKEWERSSRFAYEIVNYRWMSDLISPYKTILEIGCGTGYSTLALLKAGHKVVSVEMNQFCLNQAKKLIEQHQFKIAEGVGDLFNSDALFVKGNIADCAVGDFVFSIKDIDLVICWNIGTAWTLSVDQLLKVNGYNKTGKEYAILLQGILLERCSDKQKLLNIVDRFPEKIPVAKVIQYFNEMGKQFKFTNIRSECIETKIKSADGKVLEFEGTRIEANETTQNLISIIFEKDSL